MGMEVHHQGAADSPQRQGEVLWEPMGVARVDHDVAGGDARLGHGDEHVGHLRHRVVVAGDDVNRRNTSGTGAPPPSGTMDPSER